MKRLFLLLLLGMVLPKPAFASFTVTVLCHNFDGGPVATVTCTGTATSGHTVAVAVWNSSGTTNSITDGTGVGFTSTTQQSLGGSNIQWFYKISSTASGSTTWTDTFGVSTGGSIVVIDISATGTISADQNAGTVGASASVSSGNITTTGTDEIVLGAAGEQNDYAFSAQQVNGSNADATQADTAIDTWWKSFGSTFTGAATATIAMTDVWACSVISFKNTASAAAAPRLMLLGVGP